ncbi:MAG: FHA domain-containing protein [Pseudomonadota bacterium]
MKFIRDIIAEKRNASPAASIPSEIEEVVYPQDLSGEVSDELPSVVHDETDPADMSADDPTDDILEDEETAPSDDLEEEYEAPLDAQISGLLETLNRHEPQSQHHDIPEPDVVDGLHPEQDEFGSSETSDTLDEMNEVKDLGGAETPSASTTETEGRSEAYEPEIEAEEADETELYDSEPAQPIASGTSPVGMLKRCPPPVEESPKPALELPRPRPTGLTRSTTRLHTPAPEADEASEHSKSDNAPVRVEPAKPIAVPRPSSERSGGRSGRVKTRILGFSGSDSQEPNPFAREVGTPTAKGASFPVGWLTVIDGPGRGASITLYDGVSQIGRGKTQAVQLDFGDNSISRENHAAIAFDSEQNEFFIGHGGKANLVRLNNQPVLSTQKITSHDTIRIGETTLLLIGLCGPDFSWQEK